MATDHHHGHAPLALVEFITKGLAPPLDYAIHLAERMPSEADQEMPLFLLLCDLVTLVEVRAVSHFAIATPSPALYAQVVHLLGELAIAPVEDDVDFPTKEYVRDMQTTFDPITGLFFFSRAGSLFATGQVVLRNDPAYLAQTRRRFDSLPLDHHRKPALARIKRLQHILLDEPPAASLYARPLPSPLDFDLVDLDGPPIEAHHLFFPFSKAEQGKGADQEAALQAALRAFEFSQLLKGGKEEVESVLVSSRQHGLTKQGVCVDLIYGQDRMRFHQANPFATLGPSSSTTQVEKEINAYLRATAGIGPVGSLAAEHLLSGIERITDEANVIAFHVTKSSAVHAISLIQHLGQYARDLAAFVFNLFVRERAPLCALAAGQQRGKKALVLPPHIVVGVKDEKAYNEFFAALSEKAKHWLAEQGDSTSCRSSVSRTLFKLFQEVLALYQVAHQGASTAFAISKSAGLVIALVEGEVRIVRVRVPPPSDMATVF